MWQLDINMVCSIKHVILAILEQWDPKESQIIYMELLSYINFLPFAKEKII
jgi:hypothetical protein